MTPAEIAKLVAAMGHAWPGSPTPSKDALPIWQGVLAGISLDEAKAAILSLARDGERFAPPPGLIAKRAIENRTDDVQWAEIWADILAHFDRGWRSKNPEVQAWGDRLLELVGRDVIGQSYEDDWPVIEAQTREKFKALKARDLSDQLYAPIPTHVPRLEAARERVAGTDFVRIGDALGER